MSDRKSVAVWSRKKAVFLSLAAPGAGQLYGNKIFAALVWLPAVVLGYFVSPLLGFTAHSVCVIDAAQHDSRTNFGGAPRSRISGFATAAFAALMFVLVIFIGLWTLVAGSDVYQGYSHNDIPITKSGG